MPSPSSFGGGVAVKLEMRGQKGNDSGRKINKNEFASFDKKLKPFADFSMPELAYLNSS